MIRLLALFFGLCAIFALVVAGADAYVNGQHEHWPAVSARVASAGIRAVNRSQRNAQGIWYQLQANVIVSGSRRQIRSSSARHCDVMETWIQRHPPRSVVNVRIDPDDAHFAELVDTEGLPMPRHPKEDLELFAMAAAGCAVCALIANRLQRVR